MVWRQERSLNGDVVVFDIIKTYVSFSYVWCVYVAIGCKVTVWQGSYQMKCAWQESCKTTMDGCAVVKISSVVLIFWNREVVGDGFFRSVLNGSTKESFVQCTQGGKVCT